MGKLVVTIGVGDQQGRQFEDLEVTVDTGSTFTAVPRALLQRLGVPVRRSARSRLADGSSVPVDIGWTVHRKCYSPNSAPASGTTAVSRPSAPSPAGEPISMRKPSRLVDNSPPSARA